MCLTSYNKKLTQIDRFVENHIKNWTEMRKEITTQRKPKVR